MSHSFDTDLQIFDNTFRKEVPGHVIRVKGDHLEPSKRRNNREANKELFQELDFDFSDEDEDLMATDVCIIEGMYIDPDAGAFCPYGIQIDYYGDTDHTPQGFGIPYISVLSTHIFNQGDLQPHNKDLEDDFKAHWKETGNITDAAEAARLCVKHIARRAENK